MAIIYTYPKKDSPVLGDLVVISDSEEQNKTKQSSLSGIKTLINTTYDFYPTGNASEAFWNLEDNLAGGIQTIKMVGTGDATVSYDSLNNQIVVDSTHIDPPPPVYDLLAPAGSPAKIRLTGHSGDDDIELVSTNANLIINRVSDTEIQFTASGSGGGSPSYLGWIVEDAAANAFVVETGEEVQFLGTGGISVTASDTAGFAPYKVTIDGSGIDTTYTLGATTNASNADVTLTGSDASASTLTFIAGTNIDNISVAGSNVTINAATQGGGSCAWTVSGDTGDCLVDCGDILDIVSGDGILTEASCSPLQLEITNTADIFKTVTADSGSNSVASGLSDTLTIAGGQGITTANNGTGTITISTTDPVSGTFTPILVTQGATGTSAFGVPAVINAYTVQQGSYHVINGQVYIDFYMEFNMTAASALTNTLGVAVESLGVAVGLETLPGLTNLNTENRNNAYVGITECFARDDGGQPDGFWNLMPSGGKLNHFHGLGGNTESVAWFYWRDGVPGGKTNFTASGTEWCNNLEESISFAIAGSLNPIIVSP